MKVIGMQKRVIKSKQTGNEYQAANIYVEYPTNSVLGVRCEDIFCTADKVPSDLKLGDEINVLYNRFGRVEAIEVVK